MSVRLSHLRVRRPSLRRWGAPVAAAAILLSGGAAVAQASTGSGHGPGRGVDGFGMTMGAVHGHPSTFTYTHGYFCDTTIAAASATGCEVGADAKVAPPGHSDPLFITVPLGFDVPMQDCPSGLVCVDHPMTMDLTRLAAALAPVYKTTPEKLMPALKNFSTPGHDHLITTKAGGKAEWWDVNVIGVTDPKVYKDIQHHGSYGYVQSLLKAGNPHVLGPIPTNLYLFFAAR
jgi:hypothetical protein